MSDPAMPMPDPDQPITSEPAEDSEIDYLDDDRGDDQLPQDVVASMEAGTLLDDPTEVEPDEVEP